MSDNNQESTDNKAKQKTRQRVKGHPTTLKTDAEIKAHEKLMAFIQRGFKDRRNGG